MLNLVVHSMAFDYRNFMDFNAMTRLFFTLCLTLVSACSQTSTIRQVMDSPAPAITNVRENLERHEVQVMFSEVKRQANGDISFVEDSFQLNDDNYFYPASTVKLPVALLALEKLAESPRLNRETPFYVDGDTEPSTLANEIQKLLVVSDNEAYNRLFEYLGKDEINRRLAAKGLEARISHRLSTPNSDVLDYQTATFVTTSGKVSTKAPVSKAITKLPLAGQIKGIAYSDDSVIINQPFDFTEKNYLPVRSLHGIIKRLFFPELFDEFERFHLTESDRTFFLDTMKTLPFELGYDRTEFYDSYVKFLVLGDRKEALPENVVISNKVGFAYGTLTDTAYIQDLNTGREFVITATVLVNENQTFNDNNYEYDAVGIPFLAELGRQLTGFGDR